MDDNAVLDRILGELREWADGHTRSRMEGFRKPQAPPPPDAEDGPEALPEECRNGTCEHLEHMSDDELRRV